MIAFDLQCANGHTFEGWFESKTAFEDQKEQGLVTCPLCDDNHVCIVSSPFAVVKGEGSRDRICQSSSGFAVGAASEKMVAFMEANFDDVGVNFAKEALKIHYGVSEPRNIRGVSSPEEERVLEKEGVALFKVPLPAKKRLEDA